MFKKRVKLFLSKPCRHTQAEVMQLHSFLTFALDGLLWSTACPNCFALGKEPRYPLNRRLDGPQIHSACCGQENKPLLLAGFKPPGHPTHNLITTLSLLPWLPQNCLNIIKRGNQQMQNLTYEKQHGKISTNYVKSFKVHKPTLSREMYIWYWV